MNLKRCFVSLFLILLSTPSLATEECNFDLSKPNGPFGLTWGAPLCTIQFLKNNNSNIQFSVIERNSAFVLIQSKLLPITPKGTRSFKLLFHETFGLVQIIMESDIYNDQFDAKIGREFFQRYKQTLEMNYGNEINGKQSNYKKALGGYAYKCIQLKKCQFYSLFRSENNPSMDISLKLKAVSDRSGYISLSYTSENLSRALQKRREDNSTPRLQHDGFNTLSESL